MDARTAASEELGLDAKDWRVRRYALLAMQFEAVEVALASGERADTGELIKLDASMAEIRTSLPPQEVTVTIVSRKEVQECPKCQHSFPVQKAGESLEQRRAKALLEQSSQQSSPASPPSLPATHDAGDNNHRSTATPSPPKGKSKPAPRPYHETALRDSRPDAASKTVSNGGGGSLVWWSSKDHRGPT
jgi:hypothetical protein